MRALALFLALGLAGCATSIPVPPPVPAQLSKAATKSLDLKPICSQVKVYTDAETKALADAVTALEPTSIIIEALADYAKMRAEARACLAKG